MKITDLISNIIDDAWKIMKYDQEHHFVSVGIYDCCGSWKAWLNYGTNGIMPKSLQVVAIDGKRYVEDETLKGALTKLSYSLHQNSKILIE